MLQASATGCWSRWQPADGLKRVLHVPYRYDDPHDDGSFSVLVDGPNGTDGWRVVRRRIDGARIPRTLFPTLNQWTTG